MTHHLEDRGDGRLLHHGASGRDPAVRSLSEAFGTWVEKSMYGRKYMGVERTTMLLDGEGRIARIWPKVKVPGHAEAVLEAARALG